ncbi:MAG: ATP-binding protein [Flavobacteriaceae bacterium]|jgi:two-component system, OmpR family, phosphate regulon sensor histidine kinase PhoR|nr:ATP-binding protein [Flavobacteriaceae bacterium]MDP4674086.1 ATP-binding protein [Flavobacteriaceae bacterium]MDP4754507.1 ATP-binding protein [Flavobacteriaceae bacterium]MDP4794459.1 ATP-binding protein [Flavobacteriaceae bacterium]MDP4885089.1 ATP-binding protein [Flavobacteriaceae bacterium]
MSQKLRKPYRFAAITSLLISALLTFLVGFLFDSWSAQMTLSLVAFAFLSFVLTFVVIQWRIEQFIYSRIKKLYDDLTILQSSAINTGPVTTDMKTLTAEIEKFAQEKKLEIDGLKVREQYRKDFLGNISHELKTPLFMIQGYILTLLDGAVDDKKVAKKYLQRAAKGVDRLTYIIKDLDLITKFEAGNLTVEPEAFDAVDLVRSVFEMLEMRASKKNITLTFDMEYQQPIMVWADAEKIQQVLTNLIVNAIKYGHEDGTIEVSIEDLVKSKVIIRITDNGEGIAKEHIPRLFERFYRVDKSGSRKEGGSGLGLSIVKHIIEAHGEKIYVESVLGVGSEFSFTLEKHQKKE